MSEQRDLFSGTGKRSIENVYRNPTPELKHRFFDGPKEEDEPARICRLSGQILDIFALMKDGQPRTLSEIEAATGHPQASISAQLRHLRKPRFGRFVVEKEHHGHGLYTYRLPLSSSNEPLQIK